MGYISMLYLQANKARHLSWCGLHLVRRDSGREQVSSAQLPSDIAEADTSFVLTNFSAGKRGGSAALTT